MGRGFPFGGRCRPAFPRAPLAMMAFFKLFEVFVHNLVDLFLLFLGELTIENGVGKVRLSPDGAKADQVVLECIGREPGQFL